MFGNTDVSYKVREARYNIGLCEYCKKKHLEYSYQCQQHNNKMYKLEYQRELKDIKTIYVVGTNVSTNRNWDRGHWNRFNCYYIKDNEPHLIHFGNSSECPHWNKSKMEFQNSVLGMDRVFDIVHSLGSYLFNDGYKFKEKFLSN